MPACETTLLLVEDNDLDTILIQRLMRRLSLDCPVVRARNGEEALALLQPKDAVPGIVPPFVILLDLNMPRMDGFELLDELSRNNFLDHVPVFILTTSTNYRDRRRATRYQVRDYFVKPVTQTELLEVLDSPAQGAALQTA